MLQASKHKSYLFFSLTSRYDRRHHRQAPLQLPETDGSLPGHAPAAAAAPQDGAARVQDVPQHAGAGLPRPHHPARHRHRPQIVSQAQEYQCPGQGGTSL